MVEAAGAAALTVHGRMAQDFFSGPADWDQIAAIKPHLKRIPLIGNGDLDSAEKVFDALAALPSRRRDDRPRGAGAAVAVSPSPGGAARRAGSRRTVAGRSSGTCCCGITGWSCERFGDEKGTMLMRKYACCYAQGRPGARHFRTSIAHAETPEEFCEVGRAALSAGCRSSSVPRLCHPCYSEASIARMAKPGHG